jgi:hypothetical protein
MMTCHELFGFMTPALAREILEYVFTSDKPLYRTTLAAVAEARKLRPVFYERKPRTERHADMLSMLSRPRMEAAAANLLRGWLTKTQVAMLGDFLDGLGIPHQNGVAETIPTAIEDEKLKAALEILLGKYPPEKVAVYLNAFLTMNDVAWPNLKSLLETEPRLQLG